jgi:hypothetical protein
VASRARTLLRRRKEDGGRRSGQCRPRVDATQSRAREEWEARLGRLGGWNSAHGQ